MLYSSSSYFGVFSTIFIGCKLGLELMVNNHVVDKHGDIDILKIMNILTPWKICCFISDPNCEIVILSMKVSWYLRISLTHKIMIEMKLGDIYIYKLNSPIECVFSAIVLCF